jgi:hypothetical protein
VSTYRSEQQVAQMSKFALWLDRSDWPLKASPDRLLPFPLIALRLALSMYYRTSFLETF